MASSKPSLLRDTLPRQRLSWADIRDSSSEQLPAEASPPPPPVIDSQESYSRMFSMESVEDGGSRPSLQRQLERAALLAEAPGSSSQAAGRQVPGCSSTASASSRALPGSALEARAPTLPFLDIPEVLSEQLGKTAPTGSRAEDAPAPAGTPSSRAAGAPSSSGPRRRISWKRAPDARTPTSGKRPRGGAAEGEEPARGQRPLAEASEEDWQRREEKRQAAVAAIKDSAEYRALQASRGQGRSTTAVPGTPDANDRETSKRSWEAKVMQWRNALKEWSQHDHMS